MVNSEEINVEVTLDTQGLARELKRLEKITKEATSGMKDSFNFLDKVQDVNGKLGNAVGFLGEIKNGAQAYTAQIANSGQAITSMTRATGILSGVVGALGGPIQIATFAVSALATGIQYLTSKTGDQAQKAQELSAHLSEQQEAWNELEQAQTKKLDSDLAQINNAKKLWDELKKMQDMNGQIAESDRERADVIISYLNNAFGLEIDMMDGVIQKSDEVGAHIDKLVEKQTAQAIINSGQELYEGAVTRLEEIPNEEKTAYNNLYQTKAAKEALFKRSPMLRTGKYYSPELEALKAAEEEYQNQVKSLEAEKENLARIKSEHEDNLKYQAEEDYAAIKAVTESKVEVLRWETGATIDELEKQAEERRIYYEGLKEAYGNNPTSEQSSELERVRTEMEEAEAWVAEARKQIDQGMEDTVSNADYASAAQSKIDQMTSDTSLSTKGFTEKIKKQINDDLGDNTIFPEDGSPAKTGYKDGLGKPIAADTADGVAENAGLVANAVSDMTLDSLAAGREAANVNSPSKLFANQLGRPIAEGVAKGIKDYEKNPVEAALDMVGNVLQSAKKKADIHSPSKLFAEEIGRPMGLGVAKGLEDSKDEAVKAALDLAKKTFAASKEFIDDQVFYGRLDTEGQLAAWQSVQRQYVAGSRQRLEADRQVYSLEQKMADEAYQNSMNFINDQLYFNRMNEQDHLESLQRILRQEKLSAENRKAVEKELYKLKKDLLSQADKLEADFAKQRESRLSQLQGSSGFWSKWENKDKEDVFPSQLLDNLESQIDGKERFLAGLEALRQLDLDPALLEELQAKGLSALPYMEAIRDMSDKQREIFAARYSENRLLDETIVDAELLEEQLKMEAEVDRLRDIAEERRPDLEEAGGSLAEGLAEGILGGMSGVINATVAVARAAVAAAKSELEIHSPSRRFKEIGLMSDKGWAQGIQEGARMLRQATEWAAAHSLPSAAGAQRIMLENPVSSGTAKVTNNKTVVKEKVVGVQFTGTGAQIARLLRPQLIKEENIVGKSLLKQGI